MAIGDFRGSYSVRRQMVSGNPFYFLIYRFVCLSDPLTRRKEESAGIFPPKNVSGMVVGYRWASGLSLRIG